MMKKTTKEFENRIEKAKDVDELREIISDLPKTTFSLRISQLCQEYNTTFSKVQIQSGISKSGFYKFANGERIPKKAHVIKIGIAMGLSVEHINELLKLSGNKELYAKNKDDAIIIFGINNNLTAIQIAELLEDQGADLRLFEK